MLTDLAQPTRRRLGYALIGLGLLAVPFAGLLVAVEAGAGWLVQVDRFGTDRVHPDAVARPGVVQVLRVVSLVTEPWVLRAVIVIALVAAWRRGPRRAALWFAVTMGCGGLLVPLVKNLVGRHRPGVGAPFADGFSFPSGHATNSMLFAACVLVLAHPRLRGGRRVLLWTASTAFVLLVGYDRVALGVHYISDVVAGWALGLAVLAAALAVGTGPHPATSSTPPRTRAPSG